MRKKYFRNIESNLSRVVVMELSIVIIFICQAVISPLELLCSTVSF